MVYYKHRSIKKFDEDILGIFLRKKYDNFIINDTADYLYKTLVRNYTYRQLVFNYKCFFWKKKINFKYKPWQKIRNFQYFEDLSENALKYKVLRKQNKFKNFFLKIWLNKGSLKLLQLKKIIKFIIFNKILINYVFYLKKLKIKLFNFLNKKHKSKIWLFILKKFIIINQFIKGLKKGLLKRSNDNKSLYKFFFFKKWWSKPSKKKKWVKRKEHFKILVGGLDFVYHLNVEQTHEIFRKKRYNLKVDFYLTRKKLKLFYGFKTLKKFMFLLYSNRRFSKRLGCSYAYLLEARLEVMLYRAHFFISIKEARQAVIHKHVLVNGRVMNKPHYLITMGDIILLKNFRISKYHNFYDKLISNQILINYPVYLEVNYKLFSIMLIKNPETSEVPFPFLLNLELMKYRSIIKN